MRVSNSRWTGLLLACFASAGCGRSDETDAAPAAAVAEMTAAMAEDSLREMPCDSATVVPVDAITMVMGVAPEAFNGQEMNDCQRLMVVDGNRRLVYGPLVGLMPANARDLPLGAAEQEPATAVATLFNWGDGQGPADYTPLGIPGGSSCLWLSPDRKQAVITKREPDRSCAAATEKPTAFALEVHEHRHATAGAQFPHAARWGWDAGRSQHYIGFPCGARAWCTIGAPGFKPVEKDTLRGPERMAIPGWFDEQPLSTEDSTFPHGLKPGPVGKVYVVASMDDPGNDSTVIGITLTGDPAILKLYEDKYNLYISGNSATSTLVVRAKPGGGYDGWLTHPKKTPKQVKIGEAKPGHSGKGTVRWRWIQNEARRDEEIWFSCSAGCCFIDE